eukprot:3455945-Pleurochrysis_carterae.AAC.2
MARARAELRAAARLVNHKHAVTVAEVEPVRVVRVVRRADGVEVERLHRTHVAQHRFARDHVPRLGVVLVAVHTLDQQRLAIEQQLRALDLTMCGRE